MSKKKILIIEDNADLASLTEYNFALRGYKTLSAHEGRAGLLAGQTYRPDGIVLDRMLPDMDGREVCRKLRDIDHQVPILFVTGRRGDPKCGLCPQCAACVLIKHFSMMQLVNQMDALIAGPLEARKPTRRGPRP